MSFEMTNERNYLRLLQSVSGEPINPSGHVHSGS